MHIKAIQTRYDGCLFRSRLEARWAVFFNHLGLRWRYEPEGFEMPGFRYLPDFFLPDWDVYLEVKPDLPNEHVGDGFVSIIEDDKHTSIGKFYMAATVLNGLSQEGRVCKPRLYLLCGTPGVPKLCLGDNGLWTLQRGSILLSSGHQAVMQGNCSVWCWSANAQGEIDIWTHYLGGDPGSLITKGPQQLETPIWPRGRALVFYVGDGRNRKSPRLLGAYEAATSARFEFGRQGN